MNIGITLGLGARSVVGSQPSVILATQFGVLVGDPVANREVLSDTSFRACRNVAGDGRFILPLEIVPAGNWLLSCTVSAYDGAVSDITSLRFRVTDGPGGETLFNTITPGVVSNQPLTNVNPMYLTAVVSGSGYRVDNFRLVAA